MSFIMSFSPFFMCPNILPDFSHKTIFFCIKNTIHGLQHYKNKPFFQKTICTQKPNMGVKVSTRLRDLKMDLLNPPSKGRQIAPFYPDILKKTT